MTEFRYEKKKENIKDYLKTAMFRDNPSNKALVIALAVCLIIVAAAGVVYCVMTGSLGMLAITAAAVLLAAVYPIILVIVINRLTVKLSQSGNEDEKNVTIGVSESFILIIRNNNPCGKIEWSEITEIHEGKSGFYLIEKEGSLLMLGKDSVTSGTYDEAAQVIRARKEALPKET